MRDMIFKPGDGCGAFSILSFVGCGGTSDVYKAVHSATQEVVALKCRRLCDISDSYVVDHMLAEAELLSKLNHENVVRIQDVGIDNGVLWMAMEFLSGVSLRGLIKQSGAISVPAALYYAREIAEGVAALHKMRVIHRDLKPENVIITEQNKVKVLDTGAAKIFGKGIRQTRPGTIFGTPLYVSPEHLHEQPLDARSDVYSLGLTLYEMIAGRHPLLTQGEDPPTNHEIIVRQLRFEPPPLAGVVKGVPRYVSNFVRRAVAKDRDVRPASMEEFALEVGSMLTTFVKKTQAIFALPEIVTGTSPPMRLGGARYHRLSLKEAVDTTDDNAPTINLGPASSEPAPGSLEAAQEPLIAAAVQDEEGSPNADDDEMDSRQTMPYRSERHGAPLSPSSPAKPATPEALRDTRRSAQSDDRYASEAPIAAVSIPDALRLLDSGWSPASTSQAVVDLRRARSFKRHLPVVLGSMMMALSAVFVFARPALTQPRAASLAAAPLVDVPALVRHADHRGAAIGGEMPGATSLLAEDARACAQTGASAVIEKTITLRKQSSGLWQWRRDGVPLSAAPLAGLRYYPGDEPVAPPAPKAPVYSPTGI